jgi:hypothetical protein
MSEKTDVIFVAWENFPSDPVDALFPGIAGDTNPNTCLCYSHIGQHSAANLDYCLATTRLAKATEYSDLKEELESIGYELNLIFKPLKKHKNQRIKQLSVIGKQ